MKTKLSVILSSFLVLTFIIIVCVSVNAYNAYTTASESSCRATASANAYGLFNGWYNVYARVDTTSEQDGSTFANGNTISDSAVVDLDDGSCSSGSAYASVAGYDADNNFYSKEDRSSFQ